MCFSPRAGKSWNNFRSRARPNRGTSRCSSPVMARRKRKFAQGHRAAGGIDPRAKHLRRRPRDFHGRSAAHRRCHALAQTKNLVVVPFFISDGLHTQEDIPVLLGEPERDRRGTPCRRPADLAQPDGKKRQAGLVFARRRHRAAAGRRDFGTRAGSGRMR